MMVVVVVVVVVDGFCVRNLSALTHSPLRWPGSADMHRYFQQKMSHSPYRE